MLTSPSNQNHIAFGTKSSSISTKPKSHRIGTKKSPFRQMSNKIEKNKMFLPGFNRSDFGSTNTCPNFTTNTSDNLINSYFRHVSDFSSYNTTQQFWSLMLCVALSGLIANSTFIWTVVKTPSLHSSTYIFLTSLACSDFGNLITRVILIGQEFFADSTYASDPTIINLGIIIRQSFSSIFFMLSTGFVILASAERYLAICHPITHHKLKGTRRTAKLIAVVFLMSAVLTGLHLPIDFFSKPQICIIWPEENEFDTNPRQMLIPNTSIWLTVYYQIYYWSLGVIFFLILASVSYMYTKILATLAKRKRNTDLQMSQEFKNHLEQVSIMVIVNGGVYFLLSSILVTHIMLISLLIVDKVILGYWQIAAFSSHGVNASINPLLYYLTNQRYRCAVKAVFRGCFKITKNPQKEKLRFKLQV